jgi:AcrR family transcriptional regulator
MTTEASILTRPGKDDRRDAIVAIAHEVFLANGYAGTSMSAIAARVGGSKGTLYNYFRSKQELFIAVVERLCGRFESLLLQAEVEGGKEVAASLTHIGTRLLDLLLSEQVIATYRLVTAEAARFPEVGSALYNSGRQRAVDHLANFLQKAQAAGQLRSDADIEVAAGQFLDLCLSEILHRRLWLVMPKLTRADMDTSVATAIATFMRAYGAVT